MNVSRLTGLRNPLRDRGRAGSVDLWDGRALAVSKFYLRMIALIAAVAVVFLLTKSRYSRKALY
jgi:hypothetical protein